MMVQKRIGVVCAVVSLVALWHGVALAGTDPTPATIVDDWNAMSGGMPAKVVYWCSDNGGICVMDLATGAVTTILTQLDMGGGTWKAVAQSNSWGPFPCWSPDGTRIYFFNQDNDWSHWVMNADGSNPKRVGAIDDGGYWFASWYDNDSVVYNDSSTANSEIVKVTIDALNNPVGTTVLIPDAPYGGIGRSYVTASGTYVAWTDGSANVPTGGGHRSVVRNFNGSAPPSQDEMEVIARDDDACNICIKPDGSGTAVYCHATHLNATAKTYQDGINPATDLFVWTAVQGEQFHWLRWSQHPDYICYNDDRTLALANQRAYIRKAPAGTEWMFLGYGIWGPDLWVDTTKYPPTCSISASATDVVEDDSVDFTATATDPDGGAIASYEWDFDYDGVTFTQDATGQTASHTFDTPGTVTVALRVTDDEAETGTATVDIDVSADTDGDGMPDWWETAHSLLPGDPTDADDDPDGDGRTNLQEYQMGSDPHVDNTSAGDGSVSCAAADGTPPPGSSTTSAHLVALALLVVALLRRRRTSTIVVP